MMERNTLASIKDLKTGDRFYFSNDKKRIVWEKVQHEAKRTNYQTYTQFAKNDVTKFPQAFDSDRQVVFLRSNHLIHHI